MKVNACEETIGVQRATNGLLIAFGLRLIYPMIWMVFAAFKTNRDLFGSPSLLPTEWVFASRDTATLRAAHLAAGALTALVAQRIMVAIQWFLRVHRADHNRILLDMDGEYRVYVLR